MSDQHNEEICEKYLANEPAFTMSRYVNSVDLHKAKSQHYRSRYLDLAHQVEQLTEANEELREEKEKLRNGITTASNYIFYQQSGRARKVLDALLNPPKEQELSNE